MSASNSGFPFSIGSVLKSIVGDAASKYGGFIIGDLVKAILAGQSTDAEILQDVEDMKSQLEAIEGTLGVIEKDLLAGLSAIEKIIQDATVYTDVTTQETALEDDIAGIQATLFQYMSNVASSTGGNTDDLSVFCTDIRDGTNNLMTHITALGNGLVTGAGAPKGLINSWTRLYIIYLGDTSGATLDWAYGNLRNNWVCPGRC